MPFSTFSPPRDTREKDILWQAVAKVGCRDSRYLWADYWHQYNTITIPLLDEDAYFSDAVAAAKQAQNREHLEELLEEKSRERRRELEELVSSIGLAAFSLRTPFPSEAARLAAGKIGSTGSLDSLLQFVGWAVWGWRDNDKKDSRDGKDGERNAGGSPEEQLEKHSPTDEDSSFDFTGTQELPHMYSPHPIVSDDWDLLDHDRGHWVTELPASPGKQQLPPTTQSQTSDTVTDAEGCITTDAADVVVPLQCPATSQSTKGSSTQLTPPRGPLSGEGGDTAKQPFKQTSAADRKENEGDTVYSCRSSPQGNSKAGRKRLLHELEGSDAENERCQRRQKLSEAGRNLCGWRFRNRNLVTSGGGDEAGGGNEAGGEDGVR